MKKLYQIILCIAICFALTLTANAQWNHIGASFDYNTAGATTDGIGIGTFAGTFNSAFEIHGEAMGSVNTGEAFRTFCPVNQNAFWRLLIATTPSPTENGNIFSQTQSANSWENNNFSMTATVQDITFHTLPLAGGIGQERMRVVGVQRFSSNPFAPTTVVNAGNVGIGTPDPYSMLSIGGSLRDGSGYRTWMGVGTLASIGNFCWDQMFVGMKQHNPSGDTACDRNKEVINWGDNPSTAGAIQDMLSFVYTAPYNATGYPAQHQDGLETGRIVSDGYYGYAGFGSFDGTPYPGIDPVRRLEVLDNGQLDNNNQSVPQFRLTYTQAIPPNITTTGIWTDFQATSFGDLVILPSNQGTSRYVGINTPTSAPVGNTLEIDGVPSNYHDFAAAISGLRFNDMASSSPTTTNPGAGVLALNPFGDVIYVPDNTGTGFGLCSGTVPSLAGDAGIQFANNRIYYEGVGYTGNASDMNNSVGIGYNCGVTLPGKLSVDQTYSSGQTGNKTLAGYFHNGDQSVVTGPNYDKTGVQAASDGQFMQPAGWSLGGYANVGGDFQAANCNGLDLGIRAVATAFNGVPAIGVNTWASGVWAEAHQATNAAGVVGIGDNGDYIDIGVVGITFNAGGAQFNAGVWGSCPGSYSATNAAVYANGDGYATGVWHSFSDSKLKDNIQGLQNGMQVIMQLNPVSYTFRTNDYPGLNLSVGTQDGFLADDIQPVLPNLVKEIRAPQVIDGKPLFDSASAVTVKTLNYQGLLPWIVKGMQEQQQVIDSLSSMLSQLQSQVNGCCGTGERKAGGSDNNNNNNGNSQQENIQQLELGSLGSNVILYQNEPNPFGGSTVIRYFVPDNIKNVEIVFYDQYGKELNRMQVLQTGYGRLDISSSNLANGVYSYSIVTDGKVVDTKRMVKNQ